MSAYHELARNKQTTISQSIASMVLPSQYVHHVQEKTSVTIPDGYSDIVIANETFLDTIKLPQSNLVPLYEPSVSKTLQSAVFAQLKEYDSVWGAKGSDLHLEQKVYEWKGSLSFPAFYCWPSVAAKLWFSQFRASSEVVSS